jgi:predicted aspartyl protease
VDVEIQIEGSTNLVKVPVQVNGQGPFTFDMDTGASTTTLSDRLAKKLDIETYEDSRDDARGVGGSVSTRFAIIERMSIGNLVFENEEVYVLDLDTLLGGCGIHDGVLGHSTIKNCTLSLSYQNRRLKMQTGHSPLNKTEQKHAWCPFEYIEGSHLLQIPVKINNQGPFGFVIDTGAGSSVITPELADLLNLKRQPINGIARGIGGDIKLELAYLDQFSFDSFEQEGMQVAVVDLASVSPRGRLIEHGIIGFDILRQLELVIDYPTKQLAITSMPIPETS